MQQQEFTSYLRGFDQSDEGLEAVSRTVEDTIGITHLILLPQSYWNYIYWLEDRGDIDFAVWVTHCAVHPHEGMTLAHQLMHWLWTDICNRHRYGHPTPTDTPPPGYTPWGEAVNEA